MARLITPITEEIEIHGPTRLSELREEYPHDTSFAHSVLMAVEEGKIGLLPVGNVVHVKQAD